LSASFYPVAHSITHNGSAMVSTGIKSSEFPIKHLAKTFYFVLSFLYSSQIKRFGGLG
jgi:hypothetical protein